VGAGSASPAACPARRGAPMSRRTMTPAWSTWSGPLTGVSFIAGLAAALARSDHPYPRGLRQGRDTPLLRAALRCSLDQRRGPVDLDRVAGSVQRLGRRLRRPLWPGVANASSGDARGRRTGARLTGHARAGCRGARRSPLAGGARKTRALSRADAFIAGGPVHGLRRRAGGWLIPIGRFSGYLVIGVAAPRLSDASA
jgi:hypothetical protein